MDYNLIKNTLLEIIKEAQNLDEADLEPVGNTKVYVKKGRADEFQANAYNYFAYLNNVIITKEMDYITDVYNTLTNELAFENNEYYDSKSYELIETNSRDIAKLKALKVSLKSLDKSYNLLVKDLKHALTMGNTAEQQTTLTRINKEIDSLLENKKLIDEEINKLATSINAKVKDFIAEEMTRIRNDYRATTYGTKIAFGLDGRSILAKDKTEYDSLYNFNEMLDNLDPNNITILDDFICINPENEAAFRNLLNNTNVFKRLKKESVTEEKTDVFADPNAELNDLVSDLEAYLDELGKKISATQGMANQDIIVTQKIGDKSWAVKASDINEANRIIEIIKILQEPSNNMVNVWNIASVSEENIAKFKELVNATHYFENEIPKIDVNEIRIKEINEELKALIRKAKETENPTLAPNTYVLASDAEEFNLLNILYSYLVHARAGEDLVDIDGVKIENKYLSNYEATIQKLNALREAKAKEISEPVMNAELEPTPISTEVESNSLDEPKSEVKNQKYLDQINNLLANLTVTNVETRDKVKALKEMAEMLTFGITQSEAQYQLVIDDVVISKFDKESYLELKENLKELFKDNLSISEENLSILDSSPISSSNTKVEKAPIMDDNWQEIVNTKLQEINSRLFVLINEGQDLESNYTMIEDQKVASVHAEEFKYLAILKNIYEKSLKAPDLVAVDDIKVAVSDEELYKDTISKLNNLPKLESDGVTKEVNFELNNEEIKQIESRLNTIATKNEELNAGYETINGVKIPLNAPEEFLYLITLGDILTDAKKSSNLIEVDGLKIDAKDEERYRSVRSKLDKLYHPQDTYSFEDVPSKPVKGESHSKVKVRKLKKSKALTYIKEHKKLLIAIGLCAIASATIISALPEVLIFANSCNAIAMPGLAGFFNTMSTAVASVSNISFVNGAWINAAGEIINAGVAAQKASTATLACIASLAALGSGFATVNSVNKDPQDGKPLKDRNHSKDKILSLSSKLRSKVYDLKTNLHDLGTNLEEKIASTFQTGATDSLIAKSDTYEEIKELPPHVEDSDRITEIASEIEQNLAYSTAEVKQNIDNRAAKIEAEIGDLLGESSESPEIPSLDSLEVLLARSDSYLEGITPEGFNKEELMTAMEAKIKELQNLFNQKNAVYDANEVQKNLDHLQANYEAISKGRGL